MVYAATGHGVPNRNTFTLTIRDYESPVYKRARAGIGYLPQELMSFGR